MMTTIQIQRIYKLGSVLGLIKNDELHTLVYGITGKEHVSQLSDNEFKAVEHELLERVKLLHLTAPPKPAKKRNAPVSSGMTSGQQNKVWQLMYELAGCDRQPSSSPIGTRLCGIIKRQFQIDANAQQPFRWMNYHQGSQLIEILKKYISSAEQRVGRENAQ
nr:regulatory protein GemA [uncultured Caproiciproducens sp.]